MRLRATFAVSVVIAAASWLAATPSFAADPALALRVEAGGAGGFRDEVSEHGLAVHFAGRLTYRLASVLAAGVRVGGSFFPPAGTDRDLAHAAYEVGVTAHLAKGLWADGYLGYHDMLDQGGFGFDLSAGYDLAVGTTAGVGPFVGYSLAALDETEHFIQFGIGGSFGLAGPALAQASDTSDADQDGLAGEDDRCPDEAEDVDNYEDEDGCPDPDNDGDHILDANDECPNEAEDVDEFEDDDGCPDPDNDGDEVPDVADRCPTEREDRDDFQDDDGCPDPDNDEDQVPDATDRCPTEGEDRDGWQDDDGCPDVDNDGDGHNDADDACPNEPQTGTSTDGCPQRLRVDEGGAVRLLEPIKFRGSNLDPASNGVLDDIAAVLRGPNAPARVTVQVFSHPAGAAPALVALTQRRADAVKAALVSRQVPEDHIEAAGMGGQDPVAEGNTAAARRENERVVVKFAR